MDISNKLKTLLVGWQSDRLADVLNYATHCEGIIKENQRKNTKLNADQLHMATITMLQTVK